MGLNLGSIKMSRGSYLASAKDLFNEISAIMVWKLGHPSSRWRAISSKKLASILVAKEGYNLIFASILKGEKNDFVVFLIKIVNQPIALMSKSPNFL